MFCLSRSHNFFFFSPESLLRRRLREVKLEKRRQFESLLKRCSTWGPDGGDALDKELPAMLGMRKQ